MAATHAAQNRNGIYRVRVAVPHEVRPVIGLLELVQSLGTGNQSEARKLAPMILATFHAKIAQARQEAAPHEWRYGIGRDSFGVRIIRNLVPVGAPEIIQPALPVVAAAPALPAPATIPLASLTFGAVLDLWADEKNVPRKRKGAVSTLFAKLAKHIGHDVAGNVTADELVSFKESLVQAVKRGELDATTVANRIQILRTVFRWAAKNRKITSNPGVDLMYTAKVDPRDKRQDFSDDDMRLILTECRKHHNPVVRITNLIAAFSGARLAEIVEANKADFVQDGEHLVFHVRLDNRAATETLKTLCSARHFPLHSSIRQEVADYLATLPAGSPLFPHVKVDCDGKRGKNAGETIMRWLRGIGIKDPRKVFHSHRHTFKTACRGKLDKECRDYIMGHAAGDEAAKYGKYPAPMLAVEIEKVADPLAA